MSLVFILHDRCERGGEAVAKTSASVVNRLAIAIIVNFRALPFIRRGNEASCSSASLRIQSSSSFKRCSSSFLSRSFSSPSFRSRSFSSSSSFLFLFDFTFRLLFLKPDLFLSLRFSACLFPLFLPRAVSFAGP